MPKTVYVMICVILGSVISCNKQWVSVVVVAAAVAVAAAAEAVVVAAAVASAVVVTN